MGENIPVSWRKHTPLMLVVYVLLCVFSGGIVYVMCVISPLLKAYLLTSPCNPIDSDTVLIYQDKWISVIPEHHNCISGWIIAIQIGSVRLWASHDTDWRVTSISDVPRHFSSYIHTDIKNKHNQSLSRDVIKAQYGLNTMHLPPVCYWDILTATLLHPFYLFQYFAVAVWIAEDYIEYSAVILLITGGAVYLTTNETMINLKRLHELAGEKHTVQFISPSGELVDVSNEELLPGDRIVVTEGDMVPCDAVLLSGRVSVDESMLTGESVPVNKTPLDVDTVFVTSKTSDDEVEINRRPNHILFCGTKVVFATQGEAGDTISAGKCMAVVYRTGFRSAKGQLVASLLNPRDKFLTFFSDTLWVILLMVIVSTGLYVWSAVYLKKHGVAWSEISLYYMDTLTFAIPPAMTACLTVATGISIERLTNSNVFVSESNRVNWAGIVTTCSFDKTGTLTEDKLHFKGMSLPSHLLSSNGLNVSVEVRPADGLDNPFPLLCIELMGTCHGLALINNVPVGDVLELELLRESGFMLSPYLGSDTLYVTKTDAMTGAIRRYEILKHFEFSSDKMKSSSLVRRPDGSIIYFTKGSPEAVAKFVKPSSLPLDMADTLAQLSRSGLRVLAFAYRLITSNSELSILMEATQAQLEKDSEYLGLVFLSNALKQDTISTINTLRQADIHCNMITGDHIYTAIAIAQDCSLLRESNVHVIDTIGGTIVINHYPTGHLIEEDLCEFLLHVQEDRNLQIAVTGNALEVVKTEFPRSLSAFVRRTQVFARMKPADKQYIVEQLQASQDNFMSGDVDNDMETGLLEKKRIYAPARTSQVE